MKGLKTRSLILKLWQEELLNDAVGFRGEVRDPIGRKTKYFSDWAGLQVILADCLTVEAAERAVMNRKPTL